MKPKTKQNKNQLHQQQRRGEKMKTKSQNYPRNNKIMSHIDTVFVFYRQVKRLNGSVKLPNKQQQKTTKKKITIAIASGFKEMQPQQF